MRVIGVRGRAEGDRRQRNPGLARPTFSASGGERHQPESGPERRRVMSAQTQYLQVDATGVFPTVLLLFVLILAMLGVVAHAAFI
jgi:hypothetical protein